MRIINSMNESLIIGMLHPELQNIVDDYFIMMAKVSNEHQDRWDEKSIDISNIISEKTKKVPERKLVFEMMFKSLQFDLNQKLGKLCDIS